jgi:GTP cyclohydrolase I
MSVSESQPGPALVDDGDALPRRIDHEALQHAVGDVLRALGADVGAEGLREPPRRAAQAYAELLTPPAFRATTFPNDDGYEGLIVAEAIPFHSLCMHHLLPFRGLAHVGYLPGERIIGLSKLARVVERFARARLRARRGLLRRPRHRAAPGPNGGRHEHDAARDRVRRYVPARRRHPGC